MESYGFVFIKTKEFRGFGKEKIMENMHIAFCCDNGYIMPASIMLESLMKNNENRHIIAHTFSDDLDDTSIKTLQGLMEKYQGELVAHQVPTEAIDIIKKAPLAWEYLSITTYYRLMLPYVLDDTVEKILYLDCDVMVRKNLTKYYDCDIADKYVAGSHDIEEEQHSHRLNLPYYINAGVLVMNIKEIKQKFSMEKMLEEMNGLMAQGSLLCGDQDIINILFAQRIYLLEDAFNYQHGIHKKYVLKHKDEVKNAAVVHFITADKPWFSAYVFPYTREYYHYLKKYFNIGKKVKYWISKPAGMLKVLKKHKDYMSVK